MSNKLMICATLNVKIGNKTIVYENVAGLHVNTEIDALIFAASKFYQLGHNAIDYLPSNHRKMIALPLYKIDNWSFREEGKVYHDASK